MPDYDVSKRFLEVAERARQTQPKKKKKAAEVVDDSYATRPGASMKIARNKFGDKKDTNLPLIKTGPR